MKNAFSSLSVSRLYTPLRVCADICFYFYVVAVLSFTIAYNTFSGNVVYGVVTNLTGPWSLQIALLIGACFILGFVIVHINSAALRFILSLIPGLSLLVSPFQMEVLFQVAAWLYFVIVMTIGNFEVYLDVYRRRIRLMLIIAIVITGFLIVFRFSNDAWYGNRLMGGEEYGLIFFVLAVASLRGMRLSLGATAKMRALDTAFIVALPVLFTAAVFLFRGAVPILTQFMKLLMRIWGWLYGLFFPKEESPDLSYVTEEENEAAGDDVIIKPDVNGNRPALKPMKGVNPNLRFTAQTFLWIVIAVIAVILVIITIRLLKNRQKGPGRTGRVREHIEKVPYEKQIRRTAAEPALPPIVRQIRKTYKSYLGQVSPSYFKVGPAYTSQDVLELSCEYLDIPENKALRDIYIAARYGDPKAVTPEQAAEAKRCLSAIKAAKNNA